MGDVFARSARRVERAAGSPVAFSLALLVVLVWGATGPLFGWSDTWQLVINTGTTIVTFLMVFLIQNAQARDTAALHLKIDELLRADTKARTELAQAEEMSAAQIKELTREIIASK